VRVLVDTCIWSLALRRSQSEAHTCLEELKELIRETRVQLIGAVRQEILSGVKSEHHFEQLREHLTAFPDLSATTKDFELAVRYHNLASCKGIQGSNTDFHICAMATNHDLVIFTVDKDFQRFQTALPIRLHEPGVAFSSP
jgi:predicted nucleic acid-binding protein